MVEYQSPLIRLSGIKTSQLPSPSATPEELTPFITALLKEALPFIDSAAPGGQNPSLWKSKGTKKFPESAAKVELSERVVTLPAAGAAVADGDTKAKPKASESAETWACRRSVHIDSATKGTASWAEFARCIRDEHAETEDAFTPTVLAHREAQSWAGARDVRPVAIVGEGEGNTWWGRFSLVLVEMKHKIPPPLKPRVFPVLQLIATAVTAGSEGAEARAKDEFVVVSVPVADFTSSEFAVLSKEAGVVVGAYAAVERVKKEESGRGDVEWIMATASDAKGVLPMWVQTKAVPGQIAKDVALFLGWIAGERKGTSGQGEEEHEAKEATANKIPESENGHTSTAA
ncbi:hypothetical protein N0V93_003406 [Gnomoniopsis smithogilvyi]|uniref:DUF3074 domain-containing protein n=1 Tax=Gnomoniopsis smithogilvyi TaxID=1191159 RepID=A0A9W8YWL8_9PEZI|nr:hypothetical protein N0V93_003406 [Gnomoniopsis smithogilvyi]